MSRIKAAAERARSNRPLIIHRPYHVEIDYAQRGAFEELTDAISSARIAKQEHPTALVAVKDRATGQFVIEVDLS